ncbi:unnamed protein product [Pylaiella littoralis]
MRGGHLQVTALRACKAEVTELCATEHCNPILVRLAWHDAGTFNKDSAEPWPRCGGANGSIRFEPEINHDANAGLVIGLKLLQPIKDKHPDVGWADLIQLASATAIEQAGGPVIDMKYGRKEATTPQCCVDEGNLPSGNAPFPDANTPQMFCCFMPRSSFFTQLRYRYPRLTSVSCFSQEHLRNVFYRMGFGDEGIVALSGAHTLGRAQKDRSGEGAETSKFTEKGCCPRGEGAAPGVGIEGGSAWTPNWLKFDNSYFATVPDDGCDSELLKLATDKCLFVDEGFLPFAQKYKASQDAFFEDYKKAHKMLSELGAVWEPEGGITI